MRCCGFLLGRISRTGGGGLLGWIMACGLVRAILNGLAFLTYGFSLNSYAMLLYWVL